MTGRVWRSVRLTAEVAGFLAVIGACGSSPVEESADSAAQVVSSETDTPPARGSAEVAQPTGLRTPSPAAPPAVAEHPASAAPTPPELDALHGCTHVPTPTDLPARGSVTVRVLHADGTPAVGACVAERGSRPVHWLTDGLGQVDLPLPNHSVTHVHAAWGDTHAAFADVPRAAGVRVTVRLAPARALRGRVIGPDGAPVAGAECALHWTIDASGEVWGRLATRTTDADGVFAFPPLPPPARDAKGTLEVCAAAFAHCEVDVDPTTSLGVPLAVTLGPGLTVTGRCVDERGEPVEYASVRAPGSGLSVETSPRPRRCWGDRTEDPAVAGRFELHGLPPATPLVIADSSDLAPARIVLPHGATGTIDVGDVVLRRGATVRGVLVTSDGRPVADGRIEARDGEDGDWSRSAEADESGRFELRGLSPDGRYTITANTPREDITPRDAVLRDVRPSADEEVRLVLDLTRQIRARFVRQPGGGEVRTHDYSVRVTQYAPQRRHAAQWSHWSKDGTAEFVVALHEAGTYTVFVTVPGFEPAEVPGVRVFDDRETPLEVPLREAAR